VRVLLDENVPVGLAATLAGHEVDTVAALGWTGIKNGELLRRVAGVFDALVTTDRNLEFQQTLREQPFAVILLQATTNRTKPPRSSAKRVRPDIIKNPVTGKTASYTIKFNDGGLLTDQSGG
jgi:hypothetical protein